MLGQGRVHLCVGLGSNLQGATGLKKALRMCQLPLTPHSTCPVVQADPGSLLFWKGLGGAGSKMSWPF